MVKAIYLRAGNLAGPQAGSAVIGISGSWQKKIDLVCAAQPESCKNSCEAIVRQYPAAGPEAIILKQRLFIHFFIYVYFFTMFSLEVGPTMPVLPPLPIPYTSPVFNCLSYNCDAYSG